MNRCLYGPTIHVEYLFFDAFNIGTVKNGQAIFPGSGFILNAYIQLNSLCNTIWIVLI